VTTLVVGDVHGCAAELDELVDRVGPDRLVLVGDLFTRGPDPVGVWDTVRRAESVLGNHDDKLIEAARTGGKGALGKLVERLDRKAEGWRGWLETRPIFLEVGRWVVVHAGLHPSGRLSETTRERALYLRRWPDESPESPRWWEAYTGTQAVLFGHDARRGHVIVEDPDGGPLLVGLDSGCVYGGRLTGWIVEEERAVQVRARKAYFPT
jgi:hypothetical protein